ncbi:response regulator [Candidatus Parabeggiatoa sp. HSG14]|uniref:response regulator n=1 Tax=Candidatus Parabeggiatoa sp. HSG14 TaxID=3055593 RepID=UPI0025A8AD13|nr:response regulator [Thiotrichales bacterium HSG14]
MNQKSTVLIVDDQEAMRDALEGMLSNQGYELAFATNGQEALDIAAKLLPDIILLDVMMPGMDGFEVCQRLRADPVLAKVPIVMVTTLDDQESRVRSIEAGADDFISKPYNKLELRARVRTTTNLNRYQRLLNEQTKFKWMFENTDEAYLVLNNDNQITYINAKARLYLNLSTDVPIAENFMALLAKHYHQVHEPSKNPTPIDATLIKLPPYIVRSDTKTALPFWLRIDVMEMAGESEEKYLVHLCNVTDTILATRQGWTFSGQINHKLRTPLMPLVAGSEFLIKNCSDITTEKLQDFLEMIHTGATRLHNQINKIINYTELSKQGEATEPCIVTNLLETITTVKELLQIESLFVSQPNKIENLDDFYIPISCEGVEIVLTELFSNAQKFHPTKTPSIEVDIKAKPDSLYIQIRDNGIHLSPEQLGNMWTPYYQGSKHFTGEVKGMGLGLSMVGSLIWEVGGTCQAYNRTEGEGIVIELTLPLKKFDFELDFELE